MRLARITRGEGAGAVSGAVLVADIRDHLGRVVLGRGTRIGEVEAAMLEAAQWDVLHVVFPGDGDLVEGDAGTLLARASSGSGVEAGEAVGGHWPLEARTRGVLEVRREALRAVNERGDLAVYTLPDGQVVDRGEVVARVKIIPFVVYGAELERGIAAARNSAGLVAVRPFRPARIGVIVQESLGSSALDRFRRALEEKAAWFGSLVLEPCVVARSTRAIATALEGVAAYARQTTARTFGSDTFLVAQVASALARRGREIPDLTANQTEPGVDIAGERFQKLVDDACTTHLSLRRLRCRKQTGRQTALILDGRRRCGVWIGPGGIARSVDVLP